MKSQSTRNGMNLEFNSEGIITYEIESDDNRQPILYPKWHWAYTACKCYSAFTEPGHIAFVIGPGGCGKSSIWKTLTSTLYPGRLAGTIPIISVCAHNPDRGFFSSKYLMQQFVSQIRDPFRTSPSQIEDWPIAMAVKERLLLALPSLRKIHKGEPELRQSFISIAMAAGLKMILIDEANLICLNQKTRVPTDYLESLRSMAQEIGCRIILFGTIRLLDLVNYSGQINRRNLLIHLDRMESETRKGAGVFRDFLQHLETDMGLPSRLLVGNIKTVYRETYGIPGEVVNFIERARLMKDVEAVIDPTSASAELNWSHCQQAFRIKPILAKMRAEADHISSVLVDGGGLDGQENGTATEVNTRKKRKPLTRRPKRYRVGAPA